MGGLLHLVGLQRGAWAGCGMLRCSAVLMWGLKGYFVAILCKLIHRPYDLSSVVALSYAMLVLSQNV